MGMENIGRLLGIILCSLLDIASLTVVFIFLAKDQNHVHIEIVLFKIGFSMFDLVLLAALRFSIITGAYIGLLCNGGEAIYRIQKLTHVIVYYVCFQAVYIVIKILVYSEDHKDHIPKRFWLMIGLTLISCVTFYCCWRTLAGYKRPIGNSKFVDRDNEYVVNKLSDEICDNDQGKMNSIDQKEAENLASSEMIMKLFKMAKPDMFYILIAFIFLVICSISQSIMPYYTGLVINHIIIDKSVKKFNLALLHMALITFLAGVAAGFRAGIFTFAIGRYTLRLQQTLFSKFMEMEIGFFDVRKTGELTSRLTSDCTKVGDGLGLRLNIFTRSVVKIICILFFMSKLSWKLSTVTLIAIPIIAILSNFFGMKYKEVSENVQNALAEANISAEEVISSMRTVRSFAAEKNEVSRYSKLLDDTMTCIKKECIIACGYRWSTEMTSFIMTLLILYYGGHLVMVNELHGGNLISFILYSFDLTYSIQDIGNVYTGLMEVVGASKKVFLYVTRKPLVETNGELMPDTGIDGHIEFKNVSFAYPTREDITVLKNLSFTAEKGEVIALVGASGGGKSSVINLLQHFYEPTQGEILVDGICVRDYNHDFLHEKMSLVQQEPILFARTISENITYGLKVEVSEGDIQYSAEQANAHSFISAMPYKYKTEAGEKGVQLSGGQKQRIAIARALIRNPTILLLDEATSALDSESEHLVQQAINRNLSGRTVIIIAHRLSTVEKADKILVIQQGEVVETGTHQELVEHHGVYSALVNKQLLGFCDEESNETDKARNKSPTSCLSSISLYSNSSSVHV